MKLGLKFSLDNLTEENLRFAKQLGVTHIVVHGPRLGSGGVHDFIELLRLRKFIESQGLEAAAIENLPHDHWDDVLHAGPRRDEQLANICATVENMGRAGWPVLGYCFSIAGVWGHWRAYSSGGGRGDAGLKSFDYELVKDAPEMGKRPGLHRRDVGAGDLLPGTRGAGC